jgi:hypothetical protein
MPIIILILLIVLIANVGFWDTLQAVFGAVGIFILFWLVLAGLVAAVATWLYAKVRRRF